MQAYAIAINITVLRLAIHQYQNLSCLFQLLCIIYIYVHIYREREILLVYPVPSRPGGVLRQLLHHGDHPAHVRRLVLLAAPVHVQKPRTAAAFRIAS